MKELANKSDVVSKIVFERESIFGNGYSIRVVYVKIYNEKPFYQTQILKGNKVAYHKNYHSGKAYAIKKAKEYDADLSWYKDLELINKIYGHEE